jgi:hypothetical protein
MAMPRLTPPRLLLALAALALGATGITACATASGGIGPSDPCAMTSCPSGTHCEPSGAAGGCVPDPQPR